MSRVSMRQLRYFNALAQSLHFGRAAEQCAITQPALSMQIQEFEREIGAVLIERTRNGAQLTKEGEEVARRVARILASVQDLADYAQHSSKLLIGPLSLGVIPTIAPYMLPKLLPELRDKHPNLDLHLREAQTDHLLNGLVNGTLDAVLLSLPVAVAGIETMHLFEDPFLLAVPKDWPLKPDALVTPDLLTNERLLLLEEGHCLRDQALSFCGLKQVQNLDTFGTSSLSTIVQMVSNGFGVTLLPRISIEVEATHGNVRLLPFEKPEPHRAIGLAWRHSSPRKQDFIELGRLIADGGVGSCQPRSAHG